MASQTKLVTRQQLIPRVSPSRNKRQNSYKSSASISSLGTSSVVYYKPKSSPFRFSWSTMITFVVHAALLAAFIPFVGMVVAHVIHIEYLWPQMELMYFSPERKAREVTYPHRYCDERDITASDADELLIQPHFSPEDAMRHNVKHGVSIFPQVLRNETADGLRQFILKSHDEKEDIFVISPKSRFSAGLTIDRDPIVMQAAKEVMTHPVLRPALEKIIGKNPAVIEFSHITSMYGAETQIWHSDTDVEASAMKYARTFAPSYSLFIPLQDTTREMGATELCPGSHVCHWDFPHCLNGPGSMRVSGSQNRWPRGYGALMNQQMQHRGTAHDDKDGPERVLVVITFAPRPRFRPGEIESRIVSLGSTFSINFDHNGHTMDDYADASNAMVQPWRTLRALGLYKPSHRDWGWDFISMTSMRIVNEAYGYYPHQLEEFVEAGGFTFLPKFLHAQAYEEGDWHGYLLETFGRCEIFLRDVNILVLAVFLGCCALVDLVRRSHRKGQDSLVVRSMRRLFITHGLVLLAAQEFLFQMSRSQWAKDIRRGKLYQHSSPPSGELEPSTLPYRSDVLLETRYQSRYLGAYNHMVDVTREGNRHFRETLQNHSLGYEGLSMSMKKDLVFAIVKWSLQRGERMLTQNDGGDWYEMSQENAAAVCHRELLKVANPSLGLILTEMEYLLSEAKYGLLRETDMHSHHTSAILQNLQEQMMGMRFLDVANEQSKPYESTMKTLRAHLTDLLTRMKLNGKLREQQHQEDLPNLLRTLQARLVTHTTNLTEPVTQRKQSVVDGSFHASTLPVAVPSGREYNHRKARIPSLPPTPEIQEPYVGAWFKATDVVEAKYNGRHEWYKATIIRADADSDTYTVMHDDGEIDGGLRRPWVEPYVPPVLWDEVDVRVNGLYYLGTVIRVRSGGTFDISTEDFGILYNVSTGELRRYDQVYLEGEQVQASLVKLDEENDDDADDDDEEYWSTAVIMKVNDGPLYDIRLTGYYGGFLYDVTPDRVRPFFI